MELNLKDWVFQIDFIDRIGLAFEILEVIKNKKINLIGLEATSNERMLIKCQLAKEHLQDLRKHILAIEGIKSVQIKDFLYSEMRELELRAILNSVNEGIIGINEEGLVTHFNEVASKLFNLHHEEIIGQKIEDLLQCKKPIFELIKSGQQVNLKEVKIQRNNRSIHFLASILPIRNEKGLVIGAVATTNDYRQVEELVSKVGKKKLTTFEDIIFQSSSMKKLIDTAKTVARGNSTVILRGESGTGKELFAKAIHMESNRALGPFVAINCAALPDTLLESELFGYEEGAFTGALKGGKKGLFEQASGGTLFLDEIGEISLNIQVRLLRVLQEGTIRRVGGYREIPIDVRIITATHRNLEEMIHKREFREDLYYRLNVFPIRILPLRERREDIPIITQYLLRKICAKLNRPEICLVKENIDFLIRQDWPGNIRQLENVLERIVNVMGTEKFEIEDFYNWTNLSSPGSRQIDKNLHEKAIDPQGEKILDNDHNLNSYQEIQTDIKVFSHTPNNTTRKKRVNPSHINVEIPITNRWPSLKNMVNEVEKQILLTVLEQYPSSRKAGKVLGVSATTILNKINALGISIEKDEFQVSDAQFSAQSAN